MSFQNLAAHLKTDFVLPEAQDLAEYLASEELSENFNSDSISMIVQQSGDVISHRSEPGLVLFFSHANGVSRSWDGDPGTEGEVNLFLDFWLPIDHGYSGSPLASSSKSGGRLLVNGIARGINPETPLSKAAFQDLQVTNPLRPYSADLIPSFTLTKWLNEVDSISESKLCSWFF